MSLLPHIIFNLFLLCLSNGQSTDNPIVTLNEPNSELMGHTLKSFQGKSYYGFQDVPYGAPPVGEGRFAEPKLSSGWSGILNATTNTKFCPQTGYGEVTEDCLVLNVYSPTTNSSERLPVVVFIPGGGFSGDSAMYSKYSPGYYIDYGVIVVTVNYRAGAFGFLTTEDGVIPGNLGLKDQVVALKWVNKNIACFGGDPKKVTLSGQSAGATSASYQVLSRKATGLFRSVILESGTALSRGLFVDQARNYSFQLGKILDNSFSSNDSTVLLKILRKATVKDILEASNKVQKIEFDVGVLTDVIWGAVVEPKNYKNAFINEPMHWSLKNGLFVQVPTLIGYCSQEVHMMMGNIANDKKVAAVLDQSPANLIHLKLNINEKDRVIAGEKLGKLYTNKTFSEDLGATASYSSEIGFANSIIRKADLISSHVPVYLYQFSYTGSTHRKLDIPNEDGAGHGEELPLIWWKNANLSDADALISKRMLTMWTNFVKYLNPTPTADSTMGIPVWPRVKPDNLVYLDIDKNLTIRKDPKHYQGVKEIFNKYMKPPLNIF